MSRRKNTTCEDDDADKEVVGSHHFKYNTLSFSKHQNQNLFFCNIQIKTPRKPSIQMGISSNFNENHTHTHKIFLLINYILIGAASSCVFLILSLRLLPSLSGLLLIFLHLLTIIGAISGCSAASNGSNKWYAAHMVATVLTAIFQGSVSVLIFTTTDNFLGALKTYVREDDGTLILKLAGGLSILIFCLEWIVLVLAFVLRYYGFVEGNDGGGISMNRNSTKVQDSGERSKWASPFQPFPV